MAFSLTESLARFRRDAGEFPRLLLAGVAAGKVDRAAATELLTVQYRLVDTMAAIVAGMAERGREVVATGEGALERAEAALRKRVSPAAVAEQVARPN